ncbi:MAG TPA: ParB/RepB/Spo0J family partition protein [Acidobacteriota bacterium]|nr:ParB/RepB/Spo0J family partition protein [Acidobacteriota bacterium]
MTAKRKALGKGIGALIPESRLTPEEAGGKLLEIDIGRISPNPGQPRKSFDDDSLRELADSIIAQGIIQPIVVRVSGHDYQIVVGERRWRAAQLAGLRKVPALLHDTDDAAALEIALVENIHREDLNPVEEANAYKMLINRLGMTQDEVAERVGRKRSTIANTLRLLKLHDDVKNLLAAGEIDMGHARALLAVDDPFRQRELCDEVIRKGLNVRQVEFLVRRELKPGGSKKKSEKRKDVFLRDAGERLSRRLEAPVTIKPGSRGGRIEISYFSEDDLQRLFETLMGAAGTSGKDIH